MSSYIHNRSRAAWARGFMALCATLLAYSVLAAAVPSTPVHAQSFSGLGFLTGGTSSAALGVNADGTVVVGSGDASSIPQEAFRWTQAGGMAPLGFLPGGSLSSGARGVNADGTVVVGSSDAPGTSLEAFRWTQAGGMAGLGFLTGGNISEALAVNADGTVVVGESDSTGTGPVAFRWTQSGGIAGLGFLPGGGLSEAQGVNANGTVVVGFGNATGTGTNNEAFRWTQAGGMAGLGFLPGGTTSNATGVNADGTVVIGFGNATGTGTNNEAFRWTQAGGMAGLGFLPGGTTSNATGVNADGKVVVGSSNATGTGTNSEAFRWTQAGGMQSVKALLTAKHVSTTGWKLVVAQGVSADGQVIAGYGADPNGHFQGWIANLAVPFRAFSSQLTIDLGGPPPEDTFNLHSSFTLRSTASIDPVTEPVTLVIGTSITSVPPGSFVKQLDGSFTFAGVINGVTLNASIKPTGTLRYAFHATAKRARLTGTTNPVPVALTIGDDRGTAAVTATISR